MTVLRTAADWAARTRYGRRAVESRADLSVFREPPSARLIAGLVLLVVSFTIGWPVIGGLGVAAVWLKQPYLFLIGAPAVYAVSHIVWAVSMVLMGKDNIMYMNTLTRFGVRLLIERYGTTPQGRNIPSAAEMAPPSRSPIDSE